MTTVAIVGILGVVAMNVGGKKTPIFEEVKATNVSAVTLARRTFDPSVSNADAIAAGLPPEARARVFMQYATCQWGKIETYKHLGAVPNCDNSNSKYLEVLTQKVRVGGTLEVIDAQYLTVCPSVDGSPCVQGSYYLLEFDVSGTLQCTTKSECNSKLVQGFMGGKFFDTMRIYGQQGPNVHCYGNGTCDPVTWYMNDSKDKRSRLAISTTGSVMAINAWGSE